MDSIQTWSTIQFMALFSLTITSSYKHDKPAIWSTLFSDTPMWVSHGFCQHINIANL